MRSMIAKLAILLAIPCALFTGCGGSISGEVRSVLNAERAKQAQAEALQPVFLATCMETLKTAVDPDIGTDVTQSFRALNYCMNTSAGYKSLLKNPRRAAVLGCVYTFLTNAGYPSTPEQENSLAALCESVVKAYEGKQAAKSAPSGASGPTGVPSPTGN